MQRTATRTVIATLAASVALAVPAVAGAATRITAENEPLSGRILLGGTTGPDQLQVSGTGSVYDIADPGGVFIDYISDPAVSCAYLDANHQRCTESAPSRSGQQIEVQQGGGDDQLRLDFPTRNLSGPLAFFDVVVSNSGGADRITSVGQSNDRVATVQGSVASGPGNDTVLAKGGTLDGEAGNDTITLTDSIAPATVRGGPGADAIDTRNAFADTVSCGPDADQIQRDVIDRVDPDCESPPPPAPTEPAPTALPAKAKLKGALKVGRLPKLARALTRGVTVRLACTKKARARAVLTINKSLAKRLKIKRAIAAQSANCTPTAKSVKLRFTAKAKRKLARQKKLKLKLTVTLTGGDTGTKTVRLKA